MPAAELPILSRADLLTPTSELADRGLPAAIWGEKEGVYTNSERRVGKANPIVTPPGEAKPDFEIRAVTRDRLWDYSGARYEAIEAYGGLPWLFPEGANPNETCRRYADGHCPSQGRQGQTDSRAAGAAPRSARLPLPPHYRLHRRTWAHAHQDLTGALLDRTSPDAWLEMNPADARHPDLRSHIAHGQLFMPFHFAETNANEVTQDAFCPISRTQLQTVRRPCRTVLEKGTS